jgi:hypothetical protein
VVAKGRQSLSRSVDPFVSISVRQFVSFIMPERAELAIRNCLKRPSKRWLKLKICGHVFALAKQNTPTHYEAKI